MWDQQMNPYGAMFNYLNMFASDRDMDDVPDFQDMYPDDPSKFKDSSANNEFDYTNPVLGLSVAVLLVFCSIFLHKPTFGKTVKLIGKLPMTNQLVESLESARENVDSQENPTLDTDSLVGLIVAPFILMGYAIYFSLIVAFYAIMLYLAVSAAFLILIGSAAFMCFLLPFFLLLSLFG